MAKGEVTIESLLAENEALKNQLADLATVSAENETLKAEIEALKLQLEKSGKTAKIVPGTYKSKKHNITIQFVAGALKVRNGQEILDSAEVIKNEDKQYTSLLDHLIEVGAGIIEEVKE